MSAEILDKACQGDRNAFSALVEMHYDFIHAVAWRWCGTQGDAEDIAQDVCIRLAKAIRSFKGQSAFRTWLYTLTLNAVRDHQRRSSRQRRNQDRLASDPIFSPIWSRKRMSAATGYGRRCGACRKSSGMRSF